MAPQTSRRFNPVDNLKPLAEAGVTIFHIHSDKDDLVPLENNSLELQRRYQKFGGQAEIEIIPGLGHAEIELITN